MDIHTPCHISSLSPSLGNNVFSYDQGRYLGPDTTLVISDLSEISSLDQIQLGNFIVFEEINRGGGLQSHTGLTHTYILDTPSCKIIITDNYNQVLSYWLNHISEYQERTNISSLHYSLIQIDQHCDL